jgi:hypothetical protein
MEQQWVAQVEGQKLDLSWQRLAKIPTPSIRKKTVVLAFEKKNPKKTVVLGC